MLEFYEENDDVSVVGFSHQDHHTDDIPSVSTEAVK